MLLNYTVIHLLLFLLIMKIFKLNKDKSHLFTKVNKGEEKCGLVFRRELTKHGKGNGVELVWLFTE